MGHDVVTANNGRECLAALENGTFDIVLMDIQMPVMNGQEALREIRRKEQGCGHHQPIIALTAYSFHEDRELFLQEGFDGYVSKPMEIHILINEMRRVLGMPVDTIGSCNH
jgi:CheY-like chemotaxis protein